MSLFETHTHTIVLDIRKREKDFSTWQQITIGKKENTLSSWNIGGAQEICFELPLSEFYISL